MKGDKFSFNVVKISPVVGECIRRLLQNHPNKTKEVTVSCVAILPSSALQPAKNYRSEKYCFKTQNNMYNTRVSSSFHTLLLHVYAYFKRYYRKHFAGSNCSK